VTAASAVMNGVTRRRLLSIALAASLALNVFFVAGAVWIRLHGPLGPVPVAERADHIAAELNLDPTHRAALLRYFQDLRAHLQQMRREVSPLVTSAWTELAKPDANEAEVMRLFDEAAQKRRGFQRQVTTSTLSLLATLTPEQRKKFVELARQPRARWARPVKRGVTP
jgi:Spy/CpxP family protein refolding chaperone